MFDILNVEVEEPKRDLNDYSYTIVGEPGVGKSTLCSFLFDDCIFFTFDNNQEHIRAKKAPAPDWKTIKGYAKTLTKAYAEGKPMPFKTIIVDTATIASKMCQEYVCKENGWSHPSEMGWGQGWDAVRTEWNMTWKAFKDCGIKIVNVTHDKTKEFKIRNGETYDKIVPDVGNAFTDEVIDNVNFVFYIKVEPIKDENGNVVTEKRIIHTRGTNEYLAKSHFANLPDHIEYQDTPQATAELLKKELQKAIELEFGSPSSTKETKKQQKPEEPKVMKPQVNEQQLNDLKDRIEDIVKQKIDNKEMTIQEVVKLIEQQTGVKKIKDIETVEDAENLLQILK